MRKGRSALSGDPFWRAREKDLSVPREGGKDLSLENRVNRETGAGTAQRAHGLWITRAREKGEHFLVA